MFDPVKKVSDYVENTGSTWYIPNQSEINIFDKAVERKVLVKHKGMYTLPLIFKQEDSIAKQIIAKLHQEKKCVPRQLIDMCISIYEKEENITLDEWQKEAVVTAINENLFILTGGPGTGKTCVLKCIRFCIRHIQKTEDILFTSPTGKASRRITESVGVPAFTVASALKLHDEESEPSTIYSDVMIVDEISMLDTFTAEALFRAVKLSSKLILVGDVEQLPSVGYGSILRDLIDAGVPCVKLEKTFRQASESGIFANIEQIKIGLPNGFIKRDDFKVLEIIDNSEAKSLLVKEYLNAVKQYGKEQVVCLTPFRRKGDVCAIALNKVIQEKVNPYEKKSSITFITTEEDGFSYKQTFSEGDPVMQLVNTEKVANGDVGVVTKVSNRNVMVKFIDCELLYNKESLPQLTLAYAMSVHKSQGSEYACILTTALESDYAMLSRNTIYTAVTRAKKECRIICNPNVAQKACEKETGYERITFLKERINYYNQKYNLMKLLA